MQELPHLSQLSDSQKDELIRLLWSMLQGQGKQIAALHLLDGLLQRRDLPLLRQYHRIVFSMA